MTDTAQNVLFLFLLVGALFIALAIHSWKLEQKRRAEFVLFCKAHGLTFSPSRDHTLAHTFDFLPEIANGSNRYAENIIQGMLEDRQIIAFDHHYETKSRDSEGRTSTRHHYHCVVALSLPAAFPNLRIVPESLLSKAAQALGYDDIDFESHEFSRAFCVRSKDRKFAYDFCNPAMMEVLLTRKSLRLALQGGLLAIVHDGRQNPALLPERFRDLLTIRQRMPEYLFTA